MNTTTSPLAALERAIVILEGPSSAGRLLLARPGAHQVVQAWRRTRVPAEYCPLIERETRARGQVVLCEELRPDVAWGVVRNSEQLSKHVEEAGHEQ